MTTNQTIDVVPRADLVEIYEWMRCDWERIDGEFGPCGMTIDQDIDSGGCPPLAKLRALLDAPAINYDQKSSDHQFYTAQLQARAAKVLGLDPENTSWFEVVGEMEKAAAQPQGEPVAWLIQCQHSGLVEQAVPNDKSDYPEDWSDSFPVYREQPSQDNALKAFANDMITAAFEGVSFDGGDIQDIAVKHGLLRIEQRTEECGDVCACRSEGDGFPAECYRKTALLRGDQPAPVAVVMPEYLDTRQMD